MILERIKIISRKNLLYFLYSFLFKKTLIYKFYELSKLNSPKFKEIPRNYIYFQKQISGCND